MKYDVSSLKETSNEIENFAVDGEIRKAEIEFAKAITSF